MSEAYFARLLGLPFVAVMPATTSRDKIAAIEFQGGRCHLVDDPRAALAKWITDRSVTGLVILKDGKLRHESYYLGTAPQDLRISWSVAKSFLSALFGILHSEGMIPSLDDPVEKYAPLLKGSAYEGVSVHDILTMSSGVAFNEDYLDFNSDINRMGRVLALGGSMDEFAASLKHCASAPGSQWHYVSIDTHVLGMVMRGATGKDIPELMETRLLAPLGLEAAPYYLTDSAGISFVLGGLNLLDRLQFNVQETRRTVLYALDRPEVWQAIAEHAAQTANEAESGTRTHRALCRLVAVAADLADLLDS